MGKVSLFTLDGCPVCKKAIDLFSAKNVDVEIVSLTKSPEWKQVLFLMTGGKIIVLTNHAPWPIHYDS